MAVKTFKVLIVDDEPEARNLLGSLLKEIPNVEVVDEVDNAESALYAIIQHYPDLILMDINMPGKTGIDIVRLLKDRNVEIPVVFISAFKEYAIRAIRCEVYDFLLKPVGREELYALVEKYRRLNQKGLPGRLMEILESIKEENKIRINSRHSYILVNPSEIVFCSAEEGYTNIYLANSKTEVANTSLTQIESKVKGHDFYRLSRSVLINLNYIRSINKSADLIVLKSGDTFWDVYAPHRAVKELLQTQYNYA